MAQRTTKQTRHRFSELRRQLRTRFWSPTTTAKRPLSEPPQSVGQQRTAKARKKLGSIGANHLMVETTVKFDLGQLLITPGALDALTRNGTDEGPLFASSSIGRLGRCGRNRQERK